MTDRSDQANPEPAPSAATPDGAGQSLWGGRFSAKPAALMQAINVSIDTDRRLWAQDLAGSRAHAAMLAAREIISDMDNKAIQQGLDAIEAEIVAGTFPFRAEFEDIHMNVEARLAELIGPAAGRLHTARSRNDQVATDFRLWVRGACEGAVSALQTLQRALLAKAEAHADALMPGFTHLQPAQPVTFGHHLMAYVEMFGRDAARFADARARMNESPLGSAALAGSPFPIDREMTAKALGFERPCANSIDGVSDRDFALESLAAASICAGHLSRLAEELVIWVTPQFGFVALSDAFTTGSSIMPQKRNPDVAELARGKSGRVVGHLMALITLMKGQPLTYNKDNQEDKEPLFDTVDTVKDTLRIMAEMVGGEVDAATGERSRGMVAKADAMERAARRGYATATDLADYLVRKGVPFRDAHEVVAHAVKVGIDSGKDLSELPLDVLQGFHAGIGQDVYDVLTLRGSLNARQVIGGTAPVEAKRQIARHRARLG